MDHFDENFTQAPPVAPVTNMRYARDLLKFTSPGYKYQTESDFGIDLKKYTLFYWSKGCNIAL